MVKKILIILSLLIFIGACASRPSFRPSIYLESLPQNIITELSLDERIAIEEAWKTLNEGKGNKARKILSRLGSKSPGYYVGIGYAYFLLGKYQEALDSFKAAMNEFPDMTLIHIGLAQLYQKTQRENLAFAEYREVLKREPDHFWALKEYNLLKNNKSEEALQEAKSYLAAGNIERSKEAFLKALYYSPDSTDAHLALAKIYKEEDKLQNALVHLETASRNEPKNQEILKEYANALFHTERYQKSLDVYKQILELEPGNKLIQSRIESIKNRLGIFELPNQYNSISSKEAVSREEMAALLAVKFKGITAEVIAKPPIIIDISTSWAADFILKMTSFGILNVYSNHTFQPQKIITRAEMSEILLRLINFLKKQGFQFIQQFPPEKIKISDVSSDNYYYHAISQIVSYQFMELFPGKKFKPEQPVSGQGAIQTLDIILSLIK